MLNNFAEPVLLVRLLEKPNCKSPLKPIPAIQEPFNQVIVDCVGLLLKTKSGNQYLLTVMCLSTCFPEAIPLRNIKAPSIVKALIRFFTFVGLPKSVHLDQGSNFMSALFQQVMCQFKQSKPTAYHPQSQGALERFHQTLKSIHDESSCFRIGMRVCIYYLSSLQQVLCS